ncbi:hypothetical protein ED733_005453 [Metarhizium rileyi]|uniref:DUF4484 domain-containing protein n=1 Tax=Metarhizium rileyi (strain RCEF 4871) TaxID=1649241 RepID=A0A5C6GM08_METRR|nr:hypothetical protein ED733_005453 [Metarhizium rileyi]
MAPSRRHQRHRQSSLSTSIAPNHADQLPPISALFLIDFDVKAGYTITWKRAVPNLQLDGQVEYKSLPSGLHTVRHDLIYFVDGAFAGLSAFVNEPCEEEEARNARMIAVGILVPLSYGRLGRVWRHAENLKELAATLAKDRSQTDVLGKYWHYHKAKEIDGQLDDSTLVNLPDSPTQDRKTHKRKSSALDGTSSVPNEHRLSSFHPAWSLGSLLNKFGPLIFPIHRAALLRKRILISCHAPVHEICDFVYDISILSNLPFSIADRLPSSSPVPRLRPLFTIGVHDIPFLMEDFEASKRRQDGTADPEDEAGSGWIACTTDSILAMKDTLWDMLITMPPEHSSNAIDKAWPTVEYPRGTAVKATQRDLRRFKALRTGLARLASSSQPGEPDSPPSDSSAVRLSTSHSHRLVKDDNDPRIDELIEPLSWTALAYNGYMWWASAGEQLRSEEQEESSRDAALLADLAPAPTCSSTAFRPLSESLASLTSRRASSPDEALTELAIIAYFHRLSTQMLSILVDLVESADEAYPSSYRDEQEGVSDDQEDEAEVLLNSGGLGLAADAITVDCHSFENMGLDVWSATDAAFVKEVADAYFGRDASIEGKGVEVCGVRVC